MPPPRRRRGGPEATTPQSRPSVESPQNVTDKPMVASSGGKGACPRCGVEFAATDDDVLKHCTQLARGAA